MKDLVDFLVKRLADHPDKVEIHEFEHDGVATFQVKVAEEDKGKVIGKQGKVIKAVRTLVFAAAAKAGKRAIVEVS
ncbi:MAG: KH domain-containing protein [Elusimicrobia bacterium]|nr:KH domain-containing protein [Elusimicrobiota bacterium]